MMFIQHSIQKLHNQLLLEPNLMPVPINTVTEIIIHLNHILDQVWGHFMKNSKLLQTSNNDHKELDLYFPFQNSKISLLKHYQQLNLFCPVQTKSFAEYLSKRFEQGTSPCPWDQLLTSLQKAGVLNDQKFLMDVAINPNSFDKWIVDWLSDIQKKFIKKQNPIKRNPKLGQINNQKKEYFNRLSGVLLGCLGRHGILEKSKNSWALNFSNKKLIECMTETSTQLDIINTLVTEITNSNDWPTDVKTEEFIRWILESILVGEFQSKYPRSFEVIIREQPFIYFKDNEDFSQSWMDKLFHIANDSKHVRLTPINVKTKFGERIGYLWKCSSKYEIEYCEPLPQLYSWSLYNMPSMTSFADTNHRKKISRTAREFLASKPGSPEFPVQQFQYFEHKVWKKKGLEYYKLSDQLMEAISKNTLHDQLRKDLGNHSELGQPEVLESIKSFIITRANRQSPSFSDPLALPDFHVDIFWLLYSSFDKVKLISNTLFGELDIDEILSLDEYLLPSVTPSKYYCVSEILQNDNASELEQVQKDLDLQPSTISEVFIGLIIRKSHLLFVQGKVYEAGQSLVNFATHVKSDDNGWLFFHLIKRAVSYWKAWNGCSVETFDLEYEMIEYLYERKFLSQAMLFIPAAMQTHNYSKLNANAFGKYLELMDMMGECLKIEHGKVDKDIFLQLEKLKFDLEKLKWLGIKIRTCTDKLALLKGICSAAQTVIKLRNVLDQSFTRFVRRCIVNSGQLCFNLQIPTCSFAALLTTKIDLVTSDPNFVAKLNIPEKIIPRKKIEDKWNKLKQSCDKPEFVPTFRKKLIKLFLNAKFKQLYEACGFNDSQQLVNKYPDVINKLVEMYDSLFVIHKISNVCKHVQLRFPTQEELKDYYTPRDISQLLPFCYNEDEGWIDICTIIDKGLTEADSLIHLLFNIDKI